MKKLTPKRENGKPMEYDKGFNQYMKEARKEARLHEISALQSAKKIFLG